MQLYTLEFRVYLQSHHRITENHLTRYDITDATFSTHFVLAWYTGTTVCQTHMILLPLDDILPAFNA
jgi:hypothetical protein